MPDLWRFRIGSWLIHAGLNVMPNGRVRHELTALIEEWARHMRRALVRGGTPDA